MSAGELEIGARAVRVVMDKVQTMEVTGSDHLDLTAAEGARLIKELGQGYVAAISILRDIRTDVSKGAITCLYCQEVGRALGELPNDDFERLFKELE